MDAPHRPPLPARGPTRKEHNPKDRALGLLLRQNKADARCRSTPIGRAAKTQKPHKTQKPLGAAATNKRRPADSAANTHERSPPPLPSPEVFALRNLDEEAYQERIEREKARRFQELLIQAEARLAPHLPYYYPRINVPISYYYNAYSKCIHRKLDPELRDKKLGQVLPRFQGELYSHQLTALQCHNGTHVS